MSLEGEGYYSLGKVNTVKLDGDCENKY